MQNIYSPNKFYLSFRNDDSWNVDKIMNVKLIFTLLHKYVIFPLFYLTLINFFFLNYVKSFLSKVNSELLINKK